MTPTAGRGGALGWPGGLVIALAWVLAGCGVLGPSTPVHPLEIEVVGVLERGARVSFQISSPPGAPALPGPVELTFEPAQAVEPAGNGTWRLLQTGPLTVRATRRASEAAWSGVASLTVDLPPRIAFDMMQDGARNLYLVRLDGTDLVQLTNHPSPDAQPTVGGGWVVFQSVRGGGDPDLYRIPLGGGAIQRLTQTASVDASPSLSPAGTRLAWVSDASGVPKLWAANADGSGAARATQGFGRPGGVEAGPSWSGSGNRIAFASTELGVPDLYVLDVETGAVTSLLPPGPAFDIQPRWNPFREEVAFVSERDGGPGIFLLRLGTGEVTRLVGPESVTADPAWIEEDRIVFTAAVPGGTELRWIQVGLPERVHAIPVPGSSPRNTAAVR